MARQSLVPLLLPADPANALEAATKQYVDAHSGTGIGNVFPFMYNTSTAEAGIGTNQIRGNNTTFSASSKLWVSEITVDGLDVTIGLGRIKTGFQVYVQDYTSSARYALFNVTADATDKGAYWEITVALVNSAGTIPGGKVALQSLSTAQTSTLFSTTTTAPGLAPGSNGAAATNYLSASGAWSVPAGGGGGLDAEGAVDAVAAVLVEGTGIDITYDDAGNTITVAATGAGVAGTKLTDLTALTGAGSATDDLIEVVDISDTTMAATGTNKKMTLAELIAGIKAQGGAVANMAANSLKGNNIGATVAPTDLTAAQVKTMLAITGTDIATDSVTNTQLQPMATQTIKGNATGATAGPQDLTVAQARSMVASGAGAFFGFDFDTTTTSGPASTRLRINNATPASATIVYVSYTSKDGVDLKTRLLAGTAGDRLYIQECANSANYRVYELTGAPTDGSTYATVNVVHRGGGGSLWANSAEVVAGFTSPPTTVGTSAPSSPLTNDLWVDTT